MRAPVKYVADVRHVREVALVGTADLTFWREQLRPVGLYPSETTNQAQLMINATDLRYMGVRFRELTVSVFVSRDEGGSGQDGAYLAQAFNSSRVFAFIERVSFLTPYDHANPQLDTGPPASFRLEKGQDVVLSASTSAGTNGSRRTPSRQGLESWAGPVFLPKRRARARRNSHGHYFLAKIAGDTSVYPFSTFEDEVRFTPSPSDRVFEWLARSGFQGREWMIRGDATHAKSKTLKRHSEHWV
jgi:hypothetical protein